ncbi:phosphoenolpyruvate--protein phosphotransferase [Mycoplasmopsis pullorum]|uniref:phosphoenolpyruvate--protein phosphotransferase n=1 Tax=Mycoplasmopsis pullorum TaxID=48003 RepID=UPI00111A13DB|nr:phosphoenolpyruvate--protein phosphotransferase [Mycoplasmopsis pullorum]TNK84007.1 phosphoenolpyruvate--protein phosphotransferase [Mycoplasmopsis pullorum]TNK92246.1 phosphoenolpyruvate--protein phosphotransferase [Mycoplasmopsis pullorum]
MKIKGIGASKGVAISKVFKIEELPLEITKNAQNPELELQKYQDAQEAVMVKINKAKDLAKDPEHAAIFEAHLNFVIDPYAVDSINNMIKNENLSAEYAVKNFYDEFANMFAMMDDEYMRERAADVKDVAKKILYVLNGIEEPNLSEISEEVVIVAEDLSPSQTVQLDKKYVKGFVTNIGGPTSHTAIMARSLGIPSVVGTNNILELVKNGDVIALNGDKGEVVVNPSTEEIEHFKEEMVKYEQYLSRLALLKGRQSQTSDNHHIEIAANIGTPSDLQSVLDNDAEGIGLFRSEFLYMDNDHWPTEEEQYQAYKKVLEGMNGKRLVIRTLDIGGDKTLKYFKFPEEMNPFLGYRAIRFCLNNLDIFKTQLRALVRASAHGKLGIMVPMVTNVPEFLEAKKVFEEVYNELQSEGAKIASRENIEFGLMMETPAAAVLSDQFCKHADFVSIGTNDLIQYSMAADRMNENISYLYQPLNPSILRLVKLIIDGAHKHGKWAGMCGEMAGDRRAMPLLIGLGLDEFSMSASNVLAARELASKLSYAQMQELANKAIELESEVEVAQLLEKELNV